MLRGTSILFFSSFLPFVIQSKIEKKCKSCYNTDEFWWEVFNNIEDMEMRGLCDIKTREQST